MPPNIQILTIGPGSDGDGRKWPKHHYERNDEYYLERIATDKWIHDLGGPQPGITYRLNKLPNGYAGFQRQRPNNNHIDRYIYGHPNGQFRSLNEFYPHFKHLMDTGSPDGCKCKNCMSGNGKKRVTGSKAVESGNDSEVSGAQGERSRYFPGPARPKQPTPRKQGSLEPQGQLISPFAPKARPLQTELSDSETTKPLKRKLVDDEGVPDIYESMIDKLKAAGREDSVDVPIEERMSPDWRTGNAMSKALLEQLRQLPRYVPRPGEVVLFVRSLKDGEAITWDKSTRTFRLLEQTSGTWLAQARWEAGVVTQMAKEAISDRDLITDEDKEQAVNQSGFRVEPLSEPGSTQKPFSKQHKYVPLHAIRPFCLWKECLNGVPQEEWHPTVKNALTVSSSFCVIGRHRFKGVWPNATVFARGVYIGPELIVVGDTVRLTPRKSEQRADNVTDIMVVTAIRLRFVKMDMEDDGMSPVPARLPYQTCLHFSGRVYTLDPTRSFDGVGKVPIDPHSGIIPTGLSAFGQWYHYLDPKKPSGRVELPYTRILGRCFEDVAPKAWFGDRPDMPPSSSFQAVNTKPAIVRADDNTELTRGLQGTIEARNYSLQNDKRIKSQEGKTWFWADTRVEQLDLHEVNNRDVGGKSTERSKAQLTKWRAALKAIDGTKGGLEAYHAARKEREQQENAKRQSAYGMVAASAQVGLESATEAEADKLEEEDDDEEDEEEEEKGVDDDGNEGEAMEVDDGSEDEQESSGGGEDETPPQAMPKKIETITLSDSEDEDEDELATNQLVGELVKNIRPNDPRVRR